jgi:hypothetical protein
MHSSIWKWMLFNVALIACAPIEAMRPGEDCNSCHSRPAPRGIWAGNAPVFGAAGTLFADPRAERGLAGATVEVTDSGGKKVSMTTNEVGNFYTATRLAPPLRVRVSSGAQTITVDNDMASGDCNACHTPTSTQGPLFMNAARRLR